jgi:hypothetical protein
VVAVVVLAHAAHYDKPVLQSRRLVIAREPTREKWGFSRAIPAIDAVRPRPVSGGIDPKGEYTSVAGDLGLSVVNAVNPPGVA